MKLALSIAIASVSAFTSISSAVVVEVTPSNLGDWAMYSTDASGIINTGTAQTGFTNGPATPPLGSGSAALRTTPGPGSGSVQLRNDAYAGTPLAAITSMSYSTYVTDWNGSQVPYMTIWLDTDGNGTRDDRLWFEPPYSAAGAGNGNPSPQSDVALNTWQSWDVRNGMVYDDGPLAGPGSNAITFNAYLLAKPLATIVNDAAQGIGGIRITTGFASAGDEFKTYVDNVSIGTVLGVTTYNFELPEPTTLTAVGAAGALVLRRRRA